MASRPELENLVRDFRVSRGWSQDDLARRTGLSRAGISAIESGRLVPSTTAALSLSLAFSCRVEDLFSIPRGEDQVEAWAMVPPRFPCRYWRAEVDGRIWLYPVEAGALGVLAHDGVASDVAARVETRASASERPDPRMTLVSVRARTPRETLRRFVKFLAAAIIWSRERVGRKGSRSAKVARFGRSARRCHRN